MADPSTESIGVLLDRVIRGLEAWDRALRRAHDLTPKERAVIRLVADTVEPSPGKIAAGLGVRPSSLTTSLRELEHRGFIGSHRDPEDRRRMIVRLGHEGLVVLRDVQVLNGQISTVRSIREPMPRLIVRQFLEQVRECVEVAGGELSGRSGDSGTR